MHDQYDDNHLRAILESVKTIALVGASDDRNRPSYGVMKFLMSKGYEVYPINPRMAGQSILGRTVYGTMEDIPVPVDMVDVFRRPEALPEITDEAIKAKAKVLWFQLGLRDDEQAQKAEKAGLKVVMDRCPAQEYPRLFGR